jgi:pyridoxamine 5'-phosphate oxidase
VDEHDLDDDPIVQLRIWLEDARRTVPEPNAMTLATADGSGRPSARVVLLRGLDGRGLTFFTNRTSRKGRELERNPRAALVFHWWELGRQVRVEGAVEETSLEESSSYWQARPRASRIAAWCSPQSQPLSGREELDARYAEASARLRDGEVPLPDFWGGYRVVPDTIEFWVHRDDRLHDRVRYLRPAGGEWRRERLAP